MRITLEDIAGMASPGWGEDLDLEVLEDEGFEGVEEGDITKDEEDSEVEESQKDDNEEVLVRYDGLGRREGMATADICTRLKNEHVSKFEREFSAILKTYPQNGADFKVLLWLANGFSYHQAAVFLGRCYKTIKNTARRLRQFRDAGIVKLLPPGEVQTGEELLASLPKSRAGRKPAGAKKITTAEIIGLDLLGDPIRAQARELRKMRKAAPRARVRQEATPGQLEFAWAA